MRIKVEPLVAPGAWTDLEYSKAQGDAHTGPG